MTKPDNLSFAELCATLSPRERVFVDEYVIDLDATKAARRARYSAKTARQIGYELKRRPAVAAAIEAGLRERNALAQNEADRVIRELMLVAYADPVDLFDTKGTPVAVRDLPPEIRRAIVSLEIVVTRTGTRILKYKFVPKLPALELLGKRLKMFCERIEFDSADSLAALIKKAFDRPRPATKNGDQE